MIGLGAAVKGGDALSRWLARSAQTIQRGVKEVQNEAGEAVIKGTKRRAKSRREVTDQDHRSNVTPRPPRIAKQRLSGGGMGVSMGGQWGHARDPVIEKAMRSTGHYASMVRKQLWVAQPILGGGRMEREKMRFKDFPWLEEWAEREDRGKQRLRHAVPLPPEVRMRLSLAPALNEHQEEYVKNLRAAFLRGLA